MGLGKSSHKLEGEGSFSAVKNPFPWNEYIVKNDHGCLSLTKKGIPKLFKVIGHISLRGIRGILAHIGDALCIGGGSKCYCIIFLTFVMDCATFFL
jgi:hypothetical protein